jgi:hypothetical protein
VLRDDQSENDAPIGYVIGRGRAADFFTRLALPVLALPPDGLYRVLLHGRGFELPVKQSEPMVSFLVTYYVAARSKNRAETRAVKRVTERWRNLYAEARGELVVVAEEVERLPQRFARRSRSGFAFYPDEQQTCGI